MTVSILSRLATLPTGAPGHPLTWGELPAYLAEHCNAQEDRDREIRHKTRDDILRDGGLDCLIALIRKVFRDKKVQDLRVEWAPYARFNNPMKRVVNEVSTVYSEPAVRRVNNAANQAAYDALLEYVQFEQVMQAANRLYNGHRAILVGFRVRPQPDGVLEPVVDVVTPSSFRVVRHPNDPTLPLGYLIRTGARPARGAVGRKPSWMLWTDHEYMALDDSFVPFGETHQEHGYGLCPYVPIVRSVGCHDFWPGCEGEDLVAATFAVWFASLLQLKETKSATKQTVIAGDLAAMARGQSADSEVPSEMPEGTSMTTVDMSMDLSLFREHIDHILESVANNYGMSAAMVKHQGVQSGEARELMRVPLKELRREQQPLFRRFERRFAQVMSAVLKASGAADQAFEVDGWSIDFGEIQTPLMPNEEIDLFVKKRAAGLDSTVDFVMRHDPDKDRVAAWAFVEANIADETRRVVAMRELMKASGATSEAQTGTPGGETPVNMTTSQSGAQAA